MTPEQRAALERPVASANAPTHPTLVHQVTAQLTVILTVNK